MAFLEGWVICLHANEIIMIILIVQDGKLKKRCGKMLCLEERCLCVCKVITHDYVPPLMYIYTLNSLLRPEDVCMSLGGILS